MTNAMPGSPGMFSKKRSKACMPPDDAPIPITGKLKCEAASGKAFSDSGGRSDEQFSVM
jgi:hypothetical protein